MGCQNYVVQLAAISSAVNFEGDVHENVFRIVNNSMTIDSFYRIASKKLQHPQPSEQEIWARFGLIRAED